MQHSLIQTNTYKDIYYNLIWCIPQVYSGYRFVHRASAHGMKIAIINIGQTRGDKHADIKISAKCGDVLQRINIDANSVNDIESRVIE